MKKYIRGNSKKWKMDLLLASYEKSAGKKV